MDTDDLSEEAYEILRQAHEINEGLRDLKLDEETLPENVTAADATSAKETLMKVVSVLGSNLRMSEAEAEKITVRACRNPIEVMNMGIGFQTSCLNLLEGGNMYSSIVNAVDASKRVAYMYDSQDNRIGRVLEVLTDKGVVHYPFYDNTGLDTKKGWAKFLTSHSRAVGVDLMSDKLGDLIDDADELGLDAPGEVMRGRNVKLQRAESDVWYNDTHGARTTGDAAFKMSGHRYRTGNEVDVPVESFFDLTHIEFDANAPVDDIVEAEQRGAHIVRVSNPSPDQVEQLTAQGYVHKPRKVKHTLAIPAKEGKEDADAALTRGYYGSFSSKSRRTLKKKVAKVQDKVDAGEITVVVGCQDNMENIDGFVELYRREMEGKERGRTPLLDQLVKSGQSPQEYLAQGRSAVILKRGDEVVGGAILRSKDYGYDIGYAATNSDARDELGDLQAYIDVQAVRLCIYEGVETLTYGMDTNMYGHHLGTGLLKKKLREGFRTPVVAAGGDELVKIVDHDSQVLESHVLMYSYDAEGGLKMTAVVREGEEENLGEFRKVVEVETSTASQQPKHKPPPRITSSTSLAA